MIKKIKGKKGEGDAGLSIQQVLFYASEIAIGALIIILSLQLIFASVRNSEATLVAKDFTTTLQTISSYPYAIYFSYTGDLSQGAIQIRENTIRADLAKGTHTAPLNVIRGIKIQEKDFFNPKHIPIISLRDKIMFTEDEVQEMICEKSYKFPPKQKFRLIYDEKNADEREKLKMLQDGINLLYQQDVDTKRNNIILINYEDENAQELRISFNQDTNQTTIIYNNIINEHEAFSCYAKNIFSNNNYKEISQLYIIGTDTEKIEIKLPSVNHLQEFITHSKFEEKRQITRLNTNTALMQNYAIMIYYTLKETVELE